MDDLEYFSKPALVERAKEMGLEGSYKFKKKQLIEFIKNHSPKMIKDDHPSPKMIKDDHPSPMIDDIDSLPRSALVERAKEMGLKGSYKFKKKQLIEFIKNPSPKMIKDDHPSPKIDDIDSLPRSTLLERAKEIGLRGRYGLTKKGLIELIRNPPPPHAKYTGVKKKVTLQPVDLEGEELVFPSINAAAKHFKMNSGSFGWKVASKKEKTKNTIVIDGIKYKLRFESYTLKKKCKD